MANWSLGSDVKGVSVQGSGKGGSRYRAEMEDFMLSLKRFQKQWPVVGGVVSWVVRYVQSRSILGM